MTNSEWYIHDWYPLGHRIMDTSVEGSFKTNLGCWLSICTATGEPFLGQDTQQGNVVIVDEETPKATLEDKIARFALGLGYDWHDLPIDIHSMQGFRFSRKTALDWLLKIVGKAEPQLLRMDSVIAMLPGYRQGLVENDSSVGIALKDDLDKLLLFCKNISISAHAKKFIAELGLKQLMSLDMQEIVRGSGSIVGEAADTGIVIKKLSEYPEPTRFVLITRARRKAIPMSIAPVFVELEEESYGKGWARLKRIDPVALPPSGVARALFPLFSDGHDVTAEVIVRKAAFFSKAECRAGMEELLERKVLNNSQGSFVYRLNPNAQLECEKQYLKLLLDKNKTQ